jgi:hypothetical protein
MSRSIAVCCCECHSSLACLTVFCAALYQRPSRNPVELYQFVCTLEHIVNSSIMKHLDIHKILSDSQHGLRARRSCETQLLETLDAITKRAANNKQIDIILLDFSKAFDKVPHKKLLNKLDYYGIRSNTLQWIYSFLHDRKQPALKAICHLLSHFCNMSRSSWSLLVSDVVITSLYNKQSSAKSLAEECKFCC